MKKKVCYLMILAMLMIEASVQNYSVAAAEMDNAPQTRQTQDENNENDETQQNENDMAEERQGNSREGEDEQKQGGSARESADGQPNSEASEGEDEQQISDTSEGADEQPSSTSEDDETLPDSGNSHIEEKQNNNQEIEGSRQHKETENDGAAENVNDGIIDNIIPPADEEKDTTPPSVSLVNKKEGVSKKKDDTDIYNDGEFCFEISDDSGTESLNISIEGLTDSINADEIMSISDDGENIQCTVKLPDNVYSDSLCLLVSDNAENVTSYQFFTASKNIVDTCKPVIKVEVLEGNDKRPYDGKITNQQLEIRVNAEALSGIESFEMAFAPNDIETADLEWEQAVLEDNMYSIVIGAPLERVDGFDKDAKTGELETDEQTDTGMESVLTDSDAEEKDDGTVHEASLSIKNGTYYFRAKSYAGFENEENAKINLQQRNIKIRNAVTDKEADKSGWYNISTGAPSVWANINQSAKLSDDDTGYNLTMHMLVYKDTPEGTEKVIHTAKSTLFIKNEKDTENPKELQKAIEAFEMSADGTYTIYVWGNDEAGNYSETQKYIINADYTAPENLSITVGGIDMTNNKNDTNVIYTHFFDKEVIAEVTGSDNISQIDDSRTVLMIKNFAASSESAEGDDNITVPMGSRCYIEASLYDKAGNMSRICSDGFVTDNQAPSGKNSADFTIIPKGANSNGFFNDDFEVELYIKDQPDKNNNSALKEVNCAISNGNDEPETEQLFYFDAVNASGSQLSENSVYEDKLKIKASDYEGNEAYIEITAADNAGNAATTRKELKIDVTAPEIELKFDSNAPQNGIYYNKARTAEITIREKNFDVNGVSFEITKNGSNITELTPAAENWASDGDTHTARISFSDDGAYTIKVKCIDLADNESVYDESDYFVIDTTPPQVSVSYDKTALNEIWYNANVTAEIKIVEHNFREEDFSLISQPAKMNTPWKNDGDIHISSIIFDADGEYAYGINYTDLAGNQAAVSVNEHFIIDTQQPQIIISGVQDNSANSGDIAPFVSITDQNIDGTSIMITMTDGLNNEIGLQSSISQTEQGFTYQLLNVSGQPDSIYHLKAAASDMAGNQNIMDIRFSLNRNGSSYDITDAYPIVSQMYNKYENLHDIRLIETNVDEVQQFNIYMNRNGELVKSVNTSQKPWHFSQNKLYYTTERYGSPELGYTYEYIIYKENFQKEGSYKLTFSSVDKAGNHVNNTLENKEAQISFIVDDTPPAVYIDGVKTDKPYVVVGTSANVYIKDNFKFEEAELYLINEDNKRVKTWNYMDLVQKAQNTGEGITLDLPADGKKRSLIFYVKDCAGNEAATLADNTEVPRSPSITNGAAAEIPNPAENENQMQTAQNTPRIIAPVVIFSSVLCICILFICLAKRAKSRTDTHS